MAAKISENRIQQESYMWFHNEFPQYRGLLFSVPNGGFRLSSEAKLLQQTGLVSGVSDMIFLFNKKAYLIEMKTEQGYQSTNQSNWEAKVKSQGFEYYIIRDVNKFKQLILSIINAV